MSFVLRAYLLPWLPNWLLLYHTYTRLRWAIPHGAVIQREQSLWIGVVKRGKRGVLRRKLDIMSGKKLHSGIAFLQLPFIINQNWRLYMMICLCKNKNKPSNAWTEYILYTCLCLQNWNGQGFSIEINLFVIEGGCLT